MNTNFYNKMPCIDYYEKDSEYLAIDDQKGKDIYLCKFKSIYYGECAKKSKDVPVFKRTDILCL